MSNVENIFQEQTRNNKKLANKTPTLHPRQMYQDFRYFLQNLKVPKVVEGFNDRN